MEKSSLEVRFLPHHLAPPSPLQAIPGPCSLPLGGPLHPWPLGFSPAPSYWSLPARPTGPPKCGRQNDPPNESALISRTCGYVTLSGKGDFAAVIELRLLRRGDDPGFLNGFPAVVSVRRDYGCIGQRDAALLALKMEGAPRQGLWAACRS